MLMGVGALISQAIYRIRKDVGIPKVVFDFWTVEGKLIFEHMKIEE